MTSELRPKTTTTRFQRSVTPNVRWRSARRRSSEKSAAQCRREVDGRAAEPLNAPLWRSIVADSKRGPGLDMSKPINKVMAAVADAAGDQIIDAIGRKPPTR